MDPSLVLIVVLISISVPGRLAWRALMEPLNRAPSSEIVRQVEGLPSLYTLWAETLKGLKSAHLATVLDIVFTADPIWGAPMGQDALNFGRFLLG
jgi:hypothetical protein